MSDRTWASDQEIEPLVTNPGGVVDPADLVGRDDESARLVRAVTTGGARVLGDRRMGKTSLLRRVEQELADVGHTVIRVSAETADPAVFAGRLADGIKNHGRFGEAWRRWEKELGGELAVNVGVFGFKLVGKAAAPGSTHAETDLIRHAAQEVAKIGPYRTIFILDEITVLAEGLERATAGAAAEFMRTLRAARQEVDGVSMIIAGSVGLHHVLPDLVEVNDLDAVSVGPLPRDEAVYLARRLLRGAQIAQEREEAIASVLTDQAAAIPYFLNVFVERLAQRGMHSPTERDVATMVDEMLRDPADPLDVKHYDRRIDTYYPGEADVVRAILDTYALAPDALTVSDLQEALNAVDLDQRPGRDQLLHLIDRLEADHYLTRVGDADRMSTPLLTRVWVALRRLG